MVELKASRNVCRKRWHLRQESKLEWGCWRDIKKEKTCRGRTTEGSCTRITCEEDERKEEKEPLETNGTRLQERNQPTQPQQQDKKQKKGTNRKHTRDGMKETKKNGRCSLHELASHNQSQRWDLFSAGWASQFLFFYFISFFFLIDIVQTVVDKSSFASAQWITNSWSCSFITSESKEALCFTVLFHEQRPFPQANFGEGEQSPILYAGLGTLCFFASSVECDHQ